jgi:hypothetical protein
MGVGTNGAAAEGNSGGGLLGSGSGVEETGMGSAALGKEPAGFAGRAEMVGTPKPQDVWTCGA